MTSTQREIPTSKTPEWGAPEAPNFTAMPEDILHTPQ
nr:MAG TPA: hypothetical protein [Caudoviricetes sp.]